MKIAVIGTGSIGKRHLKTLSAIKSSEKIDEIRCYDKSPERVNEAIQKIENVTPCKKLAEAVNDVDIVFLCVPTSLHYAVWSDIKQIGDFHYFIEKPLSHSYENCDEMIFHHNRSGKHAMVGYMLRLHPLLLRAREIIQNKTILGRMLSVRSECGFYLPFWHPWEDYRDFYMSWKTGGGGALLDISHEIDYLMWLFGDISHVQGYSLTISDLEITSDDYVSSIFEFKNEMQFNVAYHQIIKGTSIKQMEHHQSLSPNSNRAALITKRTNERWGDYPPLVQRVFSSF